MLYWRGLDGEVFRMGYDGTPDSFEVFRLNIGNIGSILEQEDFLLLFGDDGGVWKWHNDAKFIDPELKSYDDFVLTSDYEGKIVSAFNSKGLFWSKTFDYNVRSAVAHDETGFVTVVTDSEEYNSEVYIIDYKNNSKAVFSGKFVDEYIVNASISPDCSHVALSGFYPEGDKTVGMIMFLRMSDGEIFSTEIFDCFYPYIEYADNDTLVAANSESLLAVTKTASVETKKDKIKTVWSRENNSNVLLGIDTIVNEGFCASFGSSDEASGNSTVKYFDMNGELSEKNEYSERIHSVRAGRESFVLYSDRCISMESPDSIRITSRPSELKYTDELLF